MNISRLIVHHIASSPKWVIWIFHMNSQWLPVLRQKLLLLVFSRSLTRSPSLSFFFLSFFLSWFFYTSIFHHCIRAFIAWFQCEAIMSECDAHVNINVPEASSHYRVVIWMFLQSQYARWHEGTKAAVECEQQKDRGRTKASLMASLLFSF